jgi:hypothetical protein
MPGARHAGPGQLREVVSLFNAGRYDDAHEVLDDLWEATSGPDSDFYKGVLQACIAMHHYALGNIDGARKLYSGHRRYLAPYLPAHLGLDVAGLLAEMERALKPALTAPPGADVAFESELRPRLALTGE